MTVQITLTSTHDDNVSRLNYKLFRLSSFVSRLTMYYETIKVLDCTIRDGGLVNKHDFSLEFVRRLYTLLSAAGIDYMEMGYKNSPELFDPKEYGPWKFCDDDLLWKVKDGIESKMKMAVMADAGRPVRPVRHAGHGCAFPASTSHRWQTAPW